MEEHRLQLLVVAADPEVHGTLREELEALGISADLHPVTDPSSAVEFLRHEGAYVGAEPPDLLLLDLDLAKAAEVLDFLARDQDLQRLPVVALGRDEATAPTSLGERRVHDVLAKPIDGDGVRRVLSYFDQI